MIEIANLFNNRIKGNGWNFYWNVKNIYYLLYVDMEVNCILLESL